MRALSFGRLSKEVGFRLRDIASPLSIGSEKALSRVKVGHDTGERGRKQEEIGNDISLSLY